MKALFRLALLVLLASGFACAQQQEVPIGDLVKKKPTRKATRVYTNADIPSRPAEEPKAQEGGEEKAAEPAAGEAAAAAKPAASTEEEEDEDPEAGLPEEVRTARRRLAEARAELQSLEERYQQMEEDLAGPDVPPSTREVYETVLAERESQLALKRSQITDAEQALAEAEKNAAQNPPPQP